ncbi:hypothetical protein HK102_012659, partial [Quaeritorhiza haematococci]
MQDSDPVRFATYVSQTFQKEYPNTSLQGASSWTTGGGSTPLSGRYTSRFFASDSGFDTVKGPTTGAGAGAGLRGAEWGFDGSGRGMKGVCEGGTGVAMGTGRRDRVDEVPVEAGDADEGGLAKKVGEIRLEGTVMQVISHEDGHVYSGDAVGNRDDALAVALAASGGERQRGRKST